MKKIADRILTIIVYLIVIIMALAILRSIFSGQNAPSLSNGFDYGFNAHAVKMINTPTATS